ncbi:MAG TPA: DUF4258 domain-containing protein [Candidatus Binatia bacterium]|nr:DUF4258 domain-containing protein [Candidatus Binatia bacterium]
MTKTLAYSRSARGQYGPRTLASGARPLPHQVLFRTRHEEGRANFTLSHHAQVEMARRAIPLDLLESVLQYPQQVVPERSGRKAYQSQVDFGAGKIFLLRAIVDDQVDPTSVVTVYRTSKISKYWRTT